MLEIYGALFTVLLLSWTGVQSSHHGSLCVFKANRYVCGRLSRHLTHKINVPQNACIIHNCDNCTKAKQTFILHEQEMQLLDPQKFILRTAEQTNSTYPLPYRCNTSQVSDTSCNCGLQRCSGTEEFCATYTCANKPSNCYCEITQAAAKVIYISEKLTLTNPPMVNFEICLFDRRYTHKVRTLLEMENAVFVQNNFTVTYTDPVLTFPDAGRAILRTDDFEYIVEVPKDRQLTVPYEIIAFRTTLTVIYVHPKGFAVTGKIQISGKSVCQIIHCIFCAEAFRRINCWPVYLQYTCYVVLFTITLLALCLFKYVCKTLLWFAKLITAIAYLAFRLAKAAARLCLLVGAYLGLTIRKSAKATHNFLEDGVGNQMNVPLLLTLILLTITTPAQSQCSDHAIITSELQECETAVGNTRKCHMSTTAELSLNNLGHESCLWFKGKNSEHLLSLKLRFLGVVCHFNTKREYYTFPVQPKHVSQISCIFSEFCGKGVHCHLRETENKPMNFETEHQESRDYPGLTTCVGGGIGVGCLVLTRAACIFRRTYYIPDLLRSFQVSSVSGHVCEYQIELQHSDNGTVTHLNVRKEATTPSGIQVRLIGAYDQPQIFMPEYLVQRVADPNEAYLVPASKRNQPKAGTIGAVQANTSYTKQFVYDPSLSQCDYYEDQLRCVTAEDAVAQMMTSRESALPSTRDLHSFRIRDGRLVSDLLASAAIRLQLKFQGFELSVESRTVCPRISSKSIQTGGCHSCQILARITFTALSTCQTGLVSVEFQRVIVHTKAIFLDTKDTELTIRFLTEEKCLKEKLCLRANTQIQCIMLDFCLDDPTLELRQLHFNYTKTSSPTTNTNLFDWLHFPALDSVFYMLKFAGAALLLLGLALTLISTMLTCCCKR